ncbi:MAG: Hsp33 family molecular chaperone HslO [Christensenellales bacterium]|jgi:molecular chaperone Hsp33
MDCLKKFLIIENSANITVLDTRELVSHAQKIHNLSPAATAALGRTLTIAAFMSSKFKDKAANLSITVDGGGPIGKIVAAAAYGAKVRGYVENPGVTVENKVKGHLDVGTAVGRRGYLEVITDLKLKEPYAGRVELVSGEIGEDFAYYFAASEQQPSALAVGVLIGGDGSVLSAGGVVMEPLPSASDFAITMMEDIASQLTDISKILLQKGADGIIKEYFSHLASSGVEEITPEYVCSCNAKKIDGVVLSLGEKEARSIIAENGAVNVHCSFCNTDYVYGEKEIAELFAKKN